MMWLMITILVFILTYGVVYVMQKINGGWDDEDIIWIALFSGLLWFIVIPFGLCVLLIYVMGKGVEYVIDKWILNFILIMRDVKGKR